MAEYSGFFNAYVDASGNYDRHYKAEDYCDNLAIVLSDGVKRGADDDLKISANGLNLTMAAGRAFIKGHYYYNSTPLEFDPLTAPTGGARYDRVILRLDNTVEVRNVSAMILTGTAAAVPTKPPITRNDDIYDIVLADVFIEANAGSVTLIDQRGNNEVCGWLYSTSGDDSFFTSLDNSFNLWFDNLREDIATTTLDVEYKQLTVMTAAGTTVNITIPQFDPDVNYNMAVYVNGAIMAEDTDYTINGRSLRFTKTLNNGTKVLIVLTMSKDGRGIPSIVDDVTELQDKVAALEQGIAYAEYNYICNGSTDNVEISNIVQTFLNAGTDYRDLHINIYGTFGAIAPVDGAGTSSNPYIFIKAGKGTATNRRCFLDFSNCSQITFPCDVPSAYYIGFWGLNIYLKNANVIMNNEQAIIHMTSTADNTRVYAENCRFWITASNGYIARGGNFINCRCSVTAVGSGAPFVFRVLSAGFLKVTGGEYYCYNKKPQIPSTVIGVSSDATNAVVITYAMSIPKVARSGYYQSDAITINSNNGLCSITDTVTTLPISATGQNVRGTIPVDKAGYI